MTSDVNRREFLKIAAGTGAALAVPTLEHAAVSSRMIGIQAGAISFVDEGTEKVLDVLQERGGHLTVAFDEHDLALKSAGGVEAALARPEK